MLICVTQYVNVHAYPRLPGRLGVTVVGGVGMGSTQPSALKTDWSLHYYKPLISPSKQRQNIWIFAVHSY